MRHYQPILPWVRLILNQQCPFSLKDEHAGISFLFPMEKLFEKYVAGVLKRCLSSRQVNVHTQLRTKYLADEPQAFQLKPDIVLARGGSCLAVMDTKWKLIDQHAAYDDGRGDPNAGIAQSDMYQLFAYGHKYPGGKGRLVLIYPKWAQFTAPLASFRLGDGLLLDVVPFDMEKDECELGE
jgi:5-methylcytosine-specific restriction enzyme subunit McrC